MTATPPKSKPLPKVYLQVCVSNDTIHETITVNLATESYYYGGDLSIIADSDPPRCWPFHESELPIIITENANGAAGGGELLPDHFLKGQMVPPEIFEAIQRENLAQPTGVTVERRGAVLEVWKINREEWSRLVLLFNPKEL